MLGTVRSVSALFLGHISTAMTERFDNVLNSCVYCSDNKLNEELIALTDENLQNKIHGSNQSDGSNELQFEITQFIIHTEYELCSLEDGLIERGLSVYVCGLVSTILSQDNSADDDNKGLSVPVKLIGPLNEWWFSGFDGGEKLLIGIDSPYSSYLLNEPHKIYLSLFEKIYSKMVITKYTIECLSDNPYSNFDELLLILREKHNLDNENFLISIDFIVRQIKNYDSFCDNDETKLSDTSAFKTLENLSGAKVFANNKNVENRKTKQKKRQNQVSKQVNTPIADSILSSIFNNIVDNFKNQSNLQGKINSNEIEFDNSKVTIGSFIQFKFNKVIYFGRITKLTNNFPNKYHVNLFCSGTDTFLGESAPINCLFATTKCIEIICNLVTQTIEVQICQSYDVENLAKHDQLFCVHLYDEDACSIESLPLQYFETESALCFGCIRKDNLPKACDKLNCKFIKGDCLLFDADLELPLFDYFNDDQMNLCSIDKDYDQDLYPEKYRKKYSKLYKDTYTKNDLANCYHIGVVDDIVIDQQTNNVQLTVRLFYRPQNIFVKFEDFLRCDLNVLYYTDCLIHIHPTTVVRKCQIFYGEKLNRNDIFQEPDKFYFKFCYNPISKEFYEPPVELKLKFCWTKFEQNIPTKKSLNILDLFSGCGGLSYGFKSIASQVFAIDCDNAAIKSFEANFKSAKVFNSDANLILELLLNENDNFIKSSLPPKGMLDMIIGGPPCQGFSEMNRFSTSEYSNFKRSLVGCFLNYIEYYRPKYFLFENVRNLASNRNSSILKIIGSFLIRLNYQIRIAVLQAGCYGVPQNRRRLFMIGAQRQLAIPPFPMPTHAFAVKQSLTSFSINGKKYNPIKACKGTYRMITIMDAIGDLNEFELNESDKCLVGNINYNPDFKMSHFQKILRQNSGLPVSDHCCKLISKLNLERIKRIPISSVADWRDLPNIEITLDDGTVIRKLEYRYNDLKNGISKNGSYRGVCSCSTGQHCRLSEIKQESTLIPWCLVHTANRQNHWSGLYGRLAWKGFFPTTVTNPDPISIQGKVIHPSQNRVVSIREVARSQGFPDDFVFCGSINEKYKQIGNAVPPILSIAIAKEFMPYL